MVQLIVDLFVFLKGGIFCTCNMYDVLSCHVLRNLFVNVNVVSVCCVLCAVCCVCLCAVLCVCECVCTTCTRTTVHTNHTCTHTTFMACVCVLYT